MSSASRSSKTELRLLARSVFLFLSLALALCVQAQDFEGMDEGNENGDIAEQRAEFVRKSMDEQMVNIEQLVSLMKKDGVYPKLMFPTLKPFGDWDYYYVQGHTITWTPNPGQTHKPVTVPKGFVTDLTSIPSLFWIKLRPEGRYAFAAVVHDYLYWKQDRTRDEADDIFKIAMLDSNVDPRLATAIHRIVKMAGQSAWDNNAKLKKNGERRVLKKFPNDFRTSWAEWKKEPDVFEKEESP